jgi:hypothetical protein
LRRRRRSGFKGADALIELIKKNGWDDHVEEFTENYRHHEEGARWQS